MQDYALYSGSSWSGRWMDDEGEMADEVHFLTLNASNFSGIYSRILFWRSWVIPYLCTIVEKFLNVADMREEHIMRAVAFKHKQVNRFYVLGDRLVDAPLSLIASHLSASESTNLNYHFPEAERNIHTTWGMFTRLWTARYQQSSRDRSATDMKWSAIADVSPYHCG